MSKCIHSLYWLKNKYTLNKIYWLKNEYTLNKIYAVVQIQNHLTNDIFQWYIDMDVSVITEKSESDFIGIFTFKHIKILSNYQIMIMI